MSFIRVNSGPRLDRLPIASFHWRILGLIAAGSFLDGFDVYLAGGVVAAMTATGFSSQNQSATFISITFIGMLLGAGIAGWIGDRWGRRSSYQFNLALFGLASIAAVFAPSMPILIGLRFAMGIGMGAELVVAAGTLCEFIPPTHRGRWAGLLGFAIACGLFVSNTVGYLLIPRFGWRAMFLVAGIGAIAVWVMRKEMPESPRWLEATGRLQQADDALCGIEKEIEKRHGPLPEFKAVETERSTKNHARMTDLFIRPTAINTFVASLAMMTTNIAIYTFVVWLPAFLIKEGQTVVHSLGYVTLMSFGGPAGALVSYAIGDRISRKQSLIGSSVCVVILGTAYAFASSAWVTIALGFALIAAIYTFVCLVSYGFVPELFPTALRLRGTGFSAMCARAAAIVTPFLAIHLYGAYGIKGVLAFVVLDFLLLIIVLALFLSGTGKKSLDDHDIASDTPLVVR